MLKIYVYKKIEYDLVGILTFRFLFVELWNQRIQDFPESLEIAFEISVKSNQYANYNQIYSESWSPWKIAV